MSENVVLHVGDHLIIRELGRSPMTALQLARLLGRSQKRVNKRLLRLYRAGIVRRCQLYFPPAGLLLGRPCFVYWAADRRRPEQQGLRHALSVADLRIAAERSFAVSMSYECGFYYTHELLIGTTSPRPDAVVTVFRSGADIGAAFLLESDLGSESLGVLRHKLRAHGDSFLSGLFRREYAALGTFSHVRVALVLPSERRLQNVARMVAAEGLTFVSLATKADVRDEINARVWRTPYRPDPEFLWKAL